MSFPTIRFRTTISNALRAGSAAAVLGAALAACAVHSTSGEAPENVREMSADGSEPAGEAAAAGPVVGDDATREYHRQGCAKAPSGARAVRFDSPWSALDSGYIPCESCRPGPPPK